MQSECPILSTCNNTNQHVVSIIFMKYFTLAFYWNSHF